MKLFASNRSTEIDTRVVENAPLLQSLAPSYIFEQHGVYYSMLRRTLDDDPGSRNIALAGPYGTGKSSILRQIAQTYGERVVEVSLLSLGEDPKDPVGPDSNPAASSKTNRIQKEIVKQLLYQQRPAAAPESRFRRIVRFRWKRELLLAAAVGTIAVLLAIIAGVDVVLAPLTLTISNRPHWMVLVALLLAVAACAGAITLGARALVRGRVGIERLTAGPATITLPARSTSYFDEYLDEIIYFFETNPRSDIVIIEDLDRFDDALIFESLRSLNSLLNSAKQIEPRSIRFIYAVRDSVFEKLGVADDAVPGDEVSAELPRSNRTKFFELVIPVVPFITHKNARDLLSTLLTDRGHTISPDLIHLAAQHLADMRLLHNVVNEYEVFKHRLLDPAQRVPELDADRLFAMILYKNAHLGDFEKIRYASSKLDELWTEWRILVRANTDRLRNMNVEIEQSERHVTAVVDYATQLGKRLRAQLNAILAAPGSPFPDAELSYNGVVVTDDQLQSSGFWSQFVAGSEPLTTHAHAYGYNTQIMTLSPDAVRQFVGMPLTAPDLATSQRRAETDTVQRNVQLIGFLQRHSWEEIAGRSEFTYQRQDGAAPVSFRDLANEVLPSKLAADLVTAGFITSYFALHVSAFYGRVIRKDALTYVMRYVDTGESEAEFVLDREDVAAILREQPASVLTERSMFNVSILDALLEDRPAAAMQIMDAASAAGDEGRTFIDLYLRVGARPDELVAHLAARTDDVFETLSRVSGVEASVRMRLLDAAIRHLSPERASTLGQDVKGDLVEHFEVLPSFHREASDVDASTVANFIADNGVVLPRLEALPAAALNVLRSTHAYKLTLGNLQAVTGSSDISIDTLASFGPRLLERAAEEAAAYAEALEQSAETEYTVSDPAHLARFLTHVEGAVPEHILAGASPSCHIADLTAVPKATWQSVVLHRRALLTAANVAAYVEAIGEVDNALAANLATVDSIAGASTLPEPQKSELALQILNTPSSAMTGSHRADLVIEMGPAPFTGAQIEPISGELIGRLIAAGVLADDEEAFAARLMVDWPTQRFAMLNSAEFIGFISPTTLSYSYVAPALDDDELATLHYPIAKAMANETGLPAAAWQAYAERGLAGAYNINASGIRKALRGGAAEGTILTLLSSAAHRITHDELREILRMLTNPWRKLADRGFGMTLVEDSPQARTLLDTLLDAEVVSKYSPVSGGLRVSLRRPK